jgi:hypothetical protein
VKTSVQVCSVKTAGGQQMHYKCSGLPYYKINCVPELVYGGVD